MCECQKKNRNSFDIRHLIVSEVKKLRHLAQPIWRHPPIEQVKCDQSHFGFVHMELSKNGLVLMWLEAIRTNDDDDENVNDVAGSLRAPDFHIRTMGILDNSMIECEKNQINKTKQNKTS